MSNFRVTRIRRFVFSFYMSGIMSFMMSGIITLINTGLASGFFSRWGAAWAVSWGGCVSIGYLRGAPGRENGRRDRAALF